MKGVFSNMSTPINSAKAASIDHSHNQVVVADYFADYVLLRLNQSTQLVGSLRFTEELLFLLVYHFNFQL